MFPHAVEPLTTHSRSHPQMDVFWRPLAAGRALKLLHSRAKVGGGDRHDNVGGTRSLPALSASVAAPGAEQSSGSSKFTDGGRRRREETPVARLPLRSVGPKRQRRSCFSLRFLRHRFPL